MALARPRDPERVLVAPLPFAGDLRQDPLCSSCSFKPSFKLFFFSCAPGQMNPLMVPLYSLSSLQWQRRGWDSLTVSLAQRSLCGLSIFCCAEAVRSALHSSSGGIAV